MTIDLKSKFAEIQQRGNQIANELRAIQERQGQLTAELHRCEGQANLLVELDPSLMPQGPQDVNPEAAAAKSAAQGAAQATPAVADSPVEYVAVAPAAAQAAPEADADVSPAPAA
jgi:hypothetical protein